MSSLCSYEWRVYVFLFVFVVFFYLWKVKNAWRWNCSVFFSAIEWQTLLLYLEMMKCLVSLFMSPFVTKIFPWECVLRWLGVATICWNLATPLATPVTTWLISFPVQNHFRSAGHFSCTHILLQMCPFPTRSAECTLRGHPGMQPTSSSGEIKTHSKKSRNYRKVCKISRMFDYIVYSVGVNILQCNMLL